MGLHIDHPRVSPWCLGRPGRHSLDQELYPFVRDDGRFPCGITFEAFHDGYTLIKTPHHERSMGREDFRRKGFGIQCIQF